MNVDLEIQRTRNYTVNRYCSRSWNAWFMQMWSELIIIRVNQLLNSHCLNHRGHMSWEYRANLTFCRQIQIPTPWTYLFGHTNYRIVMLLHRSATTTTSFLRFGARAPASNSTYVRSWNGERRWTMLTRRSTVSIFIYIVLLMKLWVFTCIVCMCSFFLQSVLLLSSIDVYFFFLLFIRRKNHTLPLKWPRKKWLIV